jgi:hypothetical protein
VYHLTRSLFSDILKDDLQTRRKGDKEKVAMAARLRRDPTMTMKWLAERLVLRSWTKVSNPLPARRRAKRWPRLHKLSKVRPFYRTKRSCAFECDGFISLNDKTDRHS